MNKPFVRIAFAGRKFSGKDTFAEIFEKKFKFNVFSFSDQLKIIALDLFPFMKFEYPPDEKEKKVVYTNPETNKAYTPRDIWQSLDILPEIYPPIFVDMLDASVLNFAKTMKEHGDEKIRICIKDVRRPAELNYIKKHGYFFVYIDTDDERSFNEKSHHKSEAFQELLQKNADRVFFNSKKVPDWRERISAESNVIANTIGIEQQEPQNLSDYWHKIRDGEI